MTALDLSQLRNELTHVLRNADVLSTTVRGVTSVTDETFNPSNGHTQITLANTPVRNVRSIEVDAVEKEIYTDWTINWTTGVVTFTDAFAGTETVTVDYDYGGSEKIYADYPRDDLNISSYPRIGFAQTSGTSTAFDLGAQSDISDFVITVFAMVPANKDSSIASGLGGTDDLADIMKNVRQAIIDNRKELVTVNYMRLLAGPNPITMSRDGKVMMQSQDILIGFVIE